MTYAEFLKRTNFNREELIAYANGTLLDDPPEGLGLLPAPPLLMFDRIVDVRHDGVGGAITAELDVAFDAWYFWCHFRNDPVQPGCLGVDAIWQLIGFYLMLRGVRGPGRALGCKEVDLAGQVRPHNRLVRYEVEIRRFSQLPDASSAVAIGTGKVYVDGEPIYVVTGARVGAFAGIGYGDYPRRSKNSVGPGWRREAGIHA